MSREVVVFFEEELDQEVIIGDEFDFFVKSQFMKMIGNDKGKEVGIEKDIFVVCKIEGFFFQMIFKDVFFIN